MNCLSCDISKLLCHVQPPLVSGYNNTFWMIKGSPPPPPPPPPPQESGLQDYLKLALVYSSLLACTVANHSSYNLYYIHCTTMPAIAFSFFSDTEMHVQYMCLHFVSSMKQFSKNYYAYSIKQLNILSVPIAVVTFTSFA